MKSLIKQIREKAKLKKEAELKYMARHEYAIGDYTDSGGALHTALLVSGLPAKYIKDGELADALCELRKLREEYINKGL